MFNVSLRIQYVDLPVELHHLEIKQTYNYSKMHITQISVIKCNQQNLPTFNFQPLHSSEK